MDFLLRLFQPKRPFKHLAVLSTIEDGCRSMQYQITATPHHYHDFLQQVSICSSNRLIQIHLLSSQGNEYLCVNPLGCIQTLSEILYEHQTIQDFQHDRLLKNTLTCTQTHIPVAYLEKWGLYDCLCDLDHIMVKENLDIIFVYRLSDQKQTIAHCLIQFKQPGEGLSITLHPLPENNTSHIYKQLMIHQYSLTPWKAIDQAIAQLKQVDTHQTRYTLYQLIHHSVVSLLSSTQDYHDLIKKIPPFTLCLYEITTLFEAHLQLILKPDACLSKAYQLLGGIHYDDPSECHDSQLKAFMQKPIWTHLKPLLTFLSQYLTYSQDQDAAVPYTLSHLNQQADQLEIRFGDIVFYVNTTSSQQLYINPKEAFKKVYETIAKIHTFKNIDDIDRLEKMICFIDVFDLSSDEGLCLSGLFVSLKSHRSNSVPMPYYS